MLTEEPTIERVITSTTRTPRGKERNGIDYHFLNKSSFEAKIAAGDFYEYACVHGNLYGTMKNAIQGKLKAGIDLLLNIDVQGAETFRETAQTDELLKGRVATVFIMPPSLKVLEQRLRGRGTENEAEIQRRMKIASEELERADCYDYVLFSKTRSEDFESLNAIYQTEKMKIREY